jgi:hypothetical protein
MGMRRIATLQPGSRRIERERLQRNSYKPA